MKSSLQSISAQELLSLLDSQVSATDKYLGQVFTEQQLAQLLDRSDLAWGNNKVEQNTAASSGVKGVFQVVQLDDKKPNLGSVKDEA